MHIRDVNLIGVCMEDIRIISSNSSKVRFSYLHVLHSHVLVSGGHGDASYTKELDRVGLHALCGRILLPDCDCWNSSWDVHHGSGA